MSMKSFQKKSTGTFLGQISWFVTFKFDMSAMRFVCEDSSRYSCFPLQSETAGNVGVVFAVSSGSVAIKDQR